MRRHILLGSGPGQKFIHKQHLAHRMFHAPKSIRGGAAHKKIYDVDEHLGGKLKKMHLKPLKFKF